MGIGDFKPDALNNGPTCDMCEIAHCRAGNRNHQHAYQRQLWAERRSHHRADKIRSDNGVRIVVQGVRLEVANVSPSLEIRETTPGEKYLPRWALATSSRTP